MSAGPTGDRDPIHERPREPHLDELRHDTLTLYGLMLHEAHQAEDRSTRGDSHSRDLNRGEQIAYEHAAHQLATLLGIAS